MRFRDITAADIEDEDMRAVCVNMRDDIREARRDDLAAHKAARADQSGENYQPKIMPGDWVWEKADKAGSSASKFDVNWVDLAIVVEMASNVSCWVRHPRDVRRLRKIHIDDLKPYKPRSAFSIGADIQTTHRSIDLMEANTNNVRKLTVDKPFCMISSMGPPPPAMLAAMDVDEDGTCL